ncbi:AmmeMemoRadiSam system protein A [Chloroflexota bacterium]
MGETVPSLILNADQKAVLLDLAYRSIDNYVRKQPFPDIKLDDPDLLQLSGVFVTIWNKSGLRGCIGHVNADMQLYKAVQEMAVSAASRDPRFDSLTEDELLEGIKVEISVLSPMARVKTIDEIIIGKHGLMIEQRGRRGLLLPKVASDRGWSKETFLEHLCMKAGLPRDSWQQDSVLYIFTAFEFGEKY